MSRVTVRVPAKINLQLAVGPLRDDGYHELVTVFCALSLWDEVTVEGSSRTLITVDGENAAAVPLGPDNLAWRAVELLAAEAGREPALAVHLHKGIPVAGGMAGGSADAAGALLAAATYWELGLPRERLLQLAAGLGSDVAFSLVGGVALGRGRGERLTTIETGGTCTWVVAVAAGGLSTPAVYAEHDRQPGPAGPPEPSAAVLGGLAGGDPYALAAAVSNDLQAAACRLRPELARTLAAGRDAGALAALLSGSGPTCLFLAADAMHGARLASMLSAAPGVRRVHVAHGPVPGAAVVPGG